MTRRVSAAEYDLAKQSGSVGQRGRMIAGKVIIRVPGAAEDAGGSETTARKDS
mgnify:CR=1 FL=1